MRNEFLDMMNELTNAFNNTNSLRSFEVNVLEGEDGYTIIAALPGVKKEDIQIDFDEGILTIKAKREVTDSKYLLKEFASANLKRAINLGDIEIESTAASFENGLLAIKLNLKKPEEKAKKSITIE